MRALLVYPEFPMTYWGFQHGLEPIGKRASLPPLGLITLAALLPSDWELRLVDTNVEPLGDDDILWSDAVLVGGMLIQEPSMHDILRRARDLGRRTVVGGPAPSTSPERFSDADVVFGGELEGRVDDLCRLITDDKGALGTTPVPGEPSVIPLRKDARPDVRTSPVPRFDLLRLPAYVSMCIQYSRGCPFQCEFCDIIEIFGRRPRMKTPGQILAELDSIRELGWHGSVFFVDDNFIGNIREVRKLLPEVKRWQELHGSPFQFYTEASVNLAGDEKLVADMVACGFTSVFLGIETPSPEALKETKKLQNLKLDLSAAVEQLTSAGLEVMAGFIVGFDSDDPSAFEAQRLFLRDAPIPLAMVGILIALPDTALWRRLESEGRLRDHSDGDAFGRTNFDTRMDEEVLLGGYRGLLAELYSHDGYLRRCEAYLEHAPVPSRRPFRTGWFKVLVRSIWAFGIRSPRRKLFWSLVVKAVKKSPRLFPWAIEKAIQGEHFLRYTVEDILPRIDLALAAVRAERDNGAVRVTAHPRPVVRLKMAPQAGRA
jgi:radical SAM superfamily enzyme YgiQ (UPF0313 family)